MDAIRNTLSQHPVVLFMKGTPERPFCGFSRVVASLLNALHVPFFSVDVLQDPELREQIKIFANWPTFPQLYVNGELIGGCDIVREMYEAGELQSLLAPFQVPS
jgi:monothiol glutaredoxin